VNNVDILLATFNGEKYLEEQINSIVRQTYTNWRIIIRDDHSTDSTLALIDKIIIKYPEKIILVKDNLGNIGPGMNFLHLTNHSDSEYIMFCDQDDVWLENKIELSLDRIKYFEKKYGKDFPILVFTNLKIVDKSLKLLSDSIWDKEKINIEKHKKLSRAIIPGPVLRGNTFLINKSLREKIIIPETVTMHDTWVSIIAACFGKIESLNEKTLLYRQHENNLFGAKPHYSFFSKIFFLVQLDKFINLKKKIQNTEKLIDSTTKQVKIFLSLYQDKLNKEDIKVLNDYINLFQKKFPQRILIILKNDLFLEYILFNLALLFYKQNDKSIR
jgi:glycosyltransferase involved in cell wall biosynthesis